MRINNDKPLVQLTEAFKGLADPTRLRIMNLLLHGELCVCHIQRVLGASQPNVSRHLNYLKHSGLVFDRREGFRVYYRLVDPRDGPLKGLFEFLRMAVRGDENLRHDLGELKRSVRDGTYPPPPNCPSPEMAASR
jgi:ArsR family transcriptional regulator